ncbi:uncharacterized protein LOC116158995 [Photinus pyralis]|uniref:uncharacterized protein LOC116158995 n=1 Tax=Photinus pyralis TaxID=7054 RepID=UPI001267419E|nr:uncharacterized protein LOC116158995 [Photinus pyralis]
MSKNWSKDEVLELIQCYEENEMLWNTRCTEYRNREKKQALLREFAIQFSCSAEEIQRKLHNLRNQVSQELKKMKKKKSGAGTDENYTTNWPYFTALKFLIPTLIPNQTESNRSETRSSIETQPVKEIESQLDEEINVVGNENTNITIENKQKKRKREKTDVDDQLFRSAIQTLQKPPDEDEIFGQYVAMELKGITNDFLKRKLKSAIRRSVNQIVDEYDMHMYGTPSTSSASLPTSPAHEDSSSCAGLFKTFTEL